MAMVVHHHQFHQHCAAANGTAHANGHESLRRGTAVSKGVLPMLFPEIGPEPGWCEPAIAGNQLMGERGMWSELNTAGLLLQGWRPDAPGLFTFANVDPSLLDQLEGMAKAEQWGIAGSESSDVLAEYLDLHFVCLVAQGLVLQSFDEHGVPTWACFCTSLLTRTSEDPIYAVLHSSTRQSALAQRPWQMYALCTAEVLRDPASPWNATEALVRVPERATFFDDPLDLLYRPPVRSLPLDYDPSFWPAALAPGAALDVAARAANVPLAALAPQGRKHALDEAVHRAQRQVLANPRLAVPRYDARRRALQLLFPLKLDADAADTHVALAVDILSTRRGARAFRAVAVVALQDAYPSARAVLPIDQAWLSQCVTPSRMRVQPQAQQQQQQARSHNHAEAEAPNAPPGFGSKLQCVDTSVHGDDKLASPPTPEPTQPPLAGSVANGTAKEVESEGASPVAAVTSAKGSSARRGFATAGLDNLEVDEDGYIVGDDNCPKLNIPALPLIFVEQFLADVSDGRRGKDRGGRKGEIAESYRAAEDYVSDCFAAWGTVSRTIVRENRHAPDTFFAIVEFVEWTDLEMRQRVLEGEVVRYECFFEHESVGIRRHREKPQHVARQLKRLGSGSSGASSSNGNRSRRVEAGACAGGEAPQSSTMHTEGTAGDAFIATRNLWVGNVASGSTQKSLAQEFERFGVVERVLVKSKLTHTGEAMAYAFVNMRSDAEAQKACDALKAKYRFGAATGSGAKTHWQHPGDVDRAPKKDAPKPRGSSSWRKPR